MHAWAQELSRLFQTRAHRVSWSLIFQTRAHRVSWSLIFQTRAHHLALRSGALKFIDLSAETLHKRLTNHVINLNWGLLRRTKCLVRGCSGFIATLTCWRFLWGIQVERNAPLLLHMRRFLLIFFFQVFEELLDSVFFFSFCVEELRVQIIDVPDGFLRSRDRL